MVIQESVEPQELCRGFVKASDANEAETKNNRCSCLKSKQSEHQPHYTGFHTITLEVAVSIAKRNSLFNAELYDFVHHSKWHAKYDACYVTHPKHPDKHIIKWIIVVDEEFDNKAEIYDLNMSLTRPNVIALNNIFYNSLSFESLKIQYSTIISFSRPM